jgi:hypothetical protein
MRELVGRLEPDLVPLPEAPAMWQAFDAVERLASSAKTLLATRVDESGVWQRAGDRSAAEYLARKSGTSLGAARSSLETSKRVRELPHTRSAMRRGELSRSQADEIAGAAAAKPDAERSLLSTAAGSSLSELREFCARTQGGRGSGPRRHRPAHPHGTAATSLDRRRGRVEPVAGHRRCRVAVERGVEPDHRRALQRSPAWAAARIPGGVCVRRAHRAGAPSSPEARRRCRHAGRRD